VCGTAKDHKYGRLEKSYIRTIKASGAVTRKLLIMAGVGKSEIGAGGQYAGPRHDAASRHEYKRGAQQKCTSLEYQLGIY
jgi:hypothetical protein